MILTMDQTEVWEDLVDEIVAAAERGRGQDLVSKMWGHPHYLFCEGFKPVVSKHGIVYCAFCKSTIDSLNDLSGWFCERCTHGKAMHNRDTGKCEMCGNACGRDGMLILSEA